jgi:hypothetical protein
MRKIQKAKLWFREFEQQRIAVVQAFKIDVVEY